MTGSRVRSRLGALLATAILTIALVPGLATAANSRDLFIGSPVLTAETDGIITLTPVSRPLGANIHSTYVEVGILSNDNQTLAHTVFTVTIPTPTGLTVGAPFDPGPSTTDADACTPAYDDTAKVTTITCNYEGLEAFGERTIAIVINIAAAFDATANQADTFISARATTNNENGSNLQLFTADSGSFQVQDFNANHVASWVANGNSKVFSTAAIGQTDAGNLSSTVAFTTSANETFSLSDGANPSGKYACPTVNGVLLTCQADFSEAVTTSGVFDDSPYFVWSLSAKVPKTYTLAQGFIAHYPTNALDYDWILFFKNKSSFCGSLAITSNGHCIRTATLTKYDKTYNLLTLVVVMDAQGGTRY